MNPQIVEYMVGYTKNLLFFFSLLCYKEGNNHPSNAVRTKFTQIRILICKQEPFFLKCAANICLLRRGNFGRERVCLEQQTCHPRKTMNSNTFCEMF